MNIKSILDEKGSSVTTLTANKTLKEAVSLLGKHKIGALVVVGAGNKIEGILSERDIVRVLSKKGAEVLSEPVASAMTSDVTTCGVDATINDVMELMTKGRYRHMPIEVDGALAGIISIGDVVKRRIEDIEREAEEIRNYIATA